MYRKIFGVAYARLADVLKKSFQDHLRGLAHAVMAAIWMTMLPRTPFEQRKAASIDAQDRPGVVV